jgi:chloride channel protein, CIC family
MRFPRPGAAPIVVADEAPIVEEGHPVSDSAGLDPTPGFALQRRFWRLLGRSALVGVFGAFAGLAFLGVTGLGETWYGETGLGWFEGHPWWIAVAAGAGLVVGLIRHFLRMPWHLPGLIEDLESQEVTTKWVPAVVAVSTVSLLGGASLGPEAALGSMGGGAGELVARRAEFDEDTTRAATLSGMSGAFGGLFSSPLLSVILVLEVGKPDRGISGKAFFASVVSSSFAFGVYFAIAGSVFLGIYDVPGYAYEDWHLLAGVGLGLTAAVVVVLTMIGVRAATRLFTRVALPTVIKPVIGGLAFGLIGFALPLTNFTGSEQLGTALQNVGSLGIGLMIAILLGKMIAFAISSASGFIGGPIFPILFVGGLTGIIVNAMFPDIPLGLAFSCMLAAVPGSIVAAPFSMVLLAALLTQVGPLQTAPILIAVGTAWITVAGVKFLLARRASVGGTEPA